MEDTGDPGRVDASGPGKNLQAAGIPRAPRTMSRMGRVLKGIALAAVAAVMLLAMVALALQSWLRSDDFRQRVEREATAALGVPLQLGRLSVDLWPLPAVAAEQVRVQTRQPITVERVEARPVWTGLLRGQLEIATLIVRRAVVPQGGIVAIGAGMEKRKPAGSPAPSSKPGALVLWPRRTVLDEVTWIDEKGQRMTMDARLDMGGDGLLDAIDAKVRAGRLAGARLHMEREGDAWPVRADVGGGRITGRLQVQDTKGGARLLQGQLRTEGVEVASLTAPSRVLSGKLQAQTTLQAEFREPAQLADALKTQTAFTVQDAVVTGIDLAKAVETVGLSRGGVTRLQTLTGQVATQGKAAQLTNLVARAQGLAASGHVAMSPSRQLTGRITVDITTAKGMLGVPLAVSGTVDAPSVMLTRGALLGAAVGTVIAPGAGTAAGASAGERLGEKLRGLFGR